MTVAVIMGSLSDKSKMQAAVDILAEFGIPCEMKIMSAHRSPALVKDYVHRAPERGIRVLICGAGMAAHLAGCVAAQTALPVIGVPLSGSALHGQDALLSTVQMPKGIPVATVAIDGAYNAGILAVQILALSDTHLAAKLRAFREKMTQDMERLNEENL
ncbi:MAG TPA: 5-(carboxyamino)imidazole ribonucleotide mutase [bacterium]|nr:5-(carboxyamino)imidazole ribonucleotide mutase [bacterium]